ncbi:DUF4062 domain-containing protein [Candidatus Bathyarchaeota archaeon]|nr:DUF4062 domain-containing protein [Candidatus Bathyarchaeota archaeon]
MAIPRVFLSSTCYDLRYIRENLKFFIKNMGFEPVLSEEGNVYYDPSKHVQDSCLAEVPNCQMFVLIIGGRFGSKYKDKPESIVNYEYREAVDKKIPIFAMVEQQVHAEYRVYQKNKENKNVDASKITYPGVDSTRIFDFMEEVQNKSVNNALVPFYDFNELESYLKLQWAGMIFSFLTQKSESERVSSTLEALTAMSNKIEFLSKQILSSVGQDIEKLNAQLYEIVSGSDFPSSRFAELFPLFSPANIISITDFRKLLIEGKVKLVDMGTVYGLVSLKTGLPLAIPRHRFEEMESAYLELRKNLLDALSKAGMKPENFVKALEERNLQIHHK